MDALTVIKKHLSCISPITIYLRIDAAAAQFLLQFNTRNRPLTQERILPIMRSLLAGTYVTTHQGLAMTRERIFIDGQHRLVAIIRTGIPAVLPITFGLDPRAIEFIDITRARQVYDTLTDTRGLRNAGRRTKYARMAARLLSDGYVTLAYPSDYDEWSGLMVPGLDWAVGALSPHPVFSIAQFVGALVFAYKANPAVVERFGEQVRTGAKLSSGHPALVLRDAIQRERSLVGKAAGKNRPLIAYWTLNALRCALEGRKMLAVDPSDEGADFFRGGSKVMNAKVKQHLGAWVVANTLPRIEQLPTSMRETLKREKPVASAKRRAA